MSGEVEGFDGVGDGVDVESAVRLCPEGGVPAGCLMVGGSDCVSGVEVDARGAVGEPEVEVIKRPQGAGGGVADVLGSAVVEAVGLLDAVADAGPARRGRRR